MAEADRLRLAARVQADYDGYGYAPLLDDDLRAVAGVGNDVAAAAAAASGNQAAAAASADAASGSAVTALTAKVAAENAVGSVTVGSTASLAYPEVNKSLFSATDVVDVCVYDTRLDSDGGAWTERFSNTSWYQETLNTATRGAKRAFPKMAILVLRSGNTNSLSLYDALDLDGSGVPRLWRVWTTGATAVLPTGIAGLTVHAVNGIIAILSIGTSMMIYTIDLPSDAASFRNGQELKIWSGTLTTTGAYVNAITAGGLGSTTGKALSMRVLPGAPIDPYTRLPEPTILMMNQGSSSGPATVHPNSVVYRWTSTLGDQVLILPDGRFRRSVGSGIVQDTLTAYSTTVRLFTEYAHPSVSTANTTLRTNVSGIAFLADDVIAGTGGVTLLVEDVGTPANGMAAFLGVDYATGWMPSSAIQLAALCRGVVGAISATSLVTNGDFATDLAGWAAGTGWAWSSGAAAKTAGVAANMTQSLSTAVGESYLICVDFTRTAGTLTIQGKSFTAASGKALVHFVATTSTTVLTIAGNSTFAGSIDNVSVKAGDADHSYQQSGLEVVGTLSRSAVATGADLAAWSGFGGANYLTQPYNAGLDVGTGDFTVMMWVLIGLTGDNAILCERIGAGGNGWRLALNGTANAVPAISIVNSAEVSQGAASVDNNATGSLKSTGWRHVVGLRRGGAMELWLDGIRYAGSTGVVTNLTNTVATLRIGSTTDQSCALLRIAGYAPTPAQITRIFRDEKVLFQTNAKAFLGGTAASTIRRPSRSRFDNSLAVPMSDGISILNGLERTERLTSASLAPAMGGNDVRAVSMEGGILAIATTANVGVRRLAVTGMDRLLANQPGSPTPRICRAMGVTTDATPLSLIPAVLMGEREMLVITATITGRVSGGADSETLTYQRRATYYRDAGGNVTIRGAVQVIGTDTEVTSTADATLVIDTATQAVTPQVTGVAAKRIAWSARLDVERNTQENGYEETI